MGSTSIFSTTEHKFKIVRNKKRGNHKGEGRGGNTGGSGNGKWASF